jgi:hypothetical protein
LISIIGPIARLQLENEFRFIKKLPSDATKSDNRIYLNLEADWNWELIREIIKASYSKHTKSEGSSLFDDLSIFDQGSAEILKENTD